MMTLWVGAGKIAASTGHSAWVSSKESRQRVFATRAQSDAIIVGGNTVRRDSKCTSIPHPTVLQ